MHDVQAEAGTSLNTETPDRDTDGPTEPDSARVPGRRGLFWVVLLIAAVWVGADQATKAWAESALSRGETRDFIPGVLEFTLVYNPGAAFSFATNATALLTVFAGGVVIFIVVMARRLRSIWWTVALGLLLGGATGNLIDRLFREPGPGRGHVVDFLRFPNFPFIDFPVFNVADIGVTSAATLIVLLALIGISPDGQPPKDSAAEESAVEASVEDITGDERAKRDPDEPPADDDQPDPAAVERRHDD